MTSNSQTKLAPEITSILLQQPEDLNVYIASKQELDQMKLYQFDLVINKQKHHKELENQVYQNLMEEFNKKREFLFIFGQTANW